MPNDCRVHGDTARLRKPLASRWGGHGPPWRSCTLPCLMHLVGKTAWASRVRCLHFGCCIRRCRCAPTPHIGCGVVLVSCLLLVSDLCCSRAWGCPHFGPIAPVSHGVTGSFPRVGRHSLFPCGSREVPCSLADVICECRLSVGHCQPSRVGCLHVGCGFWRGRCVPKPYSGSGLSRGAGSADYFVVRLCLVCVLAHWRAGLLAGSLAYRLVRWPSRLLAGWWAFGGILGQLPL